MPELRFRAMSGDAASKNEGAPRSFLQEQGKKSSFLFEPDEVLTISKPAHLRMDCSDIKNGDNSPQIFFLGGFQIVANAKHSEVYLTNKEGKEEYLMTAKGISLDKGPNGEEWHKAVCVVPGGPRPILGLQVKLLSLKPSSDTAARVQFIKLTARLPDVAASSTPPSTVSDAATTTTPATPLHPTTTSPPSTTTAPTMTRPAPAGITQADLGAAMASLSIIARSTEDSIEKAMNEKFSHLESVFQTRSTVLEHHVAALTNVTLSQRKTWEEQTKILEMQQTMMQAQSEQIKSLLEQQALMSKTLQDLRAELSSLREEVKKEKAQESFIRPSIGTLRIRNRPPLIDEEPVEGGIERTLSTLDSDDLDHDVAATLAVDGETIPQTQAVANGKRIIVPLRQHQDKHKHGVPDLLEEGEKIEVSLLDGGTEASMQGHVHEEKIELPDIPEEAAMTINSDIKIPKKAFSFEDRNDKNEAKEADEVDAPHKVELEVMAGSDDDKTFEVLHSTTADEHERSPPEVSQSNLLQL